MIFHLQKFGDIIRSPADSGSGSVWRPFKMEGSQDARIASLETFYDFWIDAVTDPDQALMRDRGFRERLMAHPDVAACMNVREQSVLSMEDKIVPPENPGNKEGARLVADYVNSVWQRIPGRDLFYQSQQQAIPWGGIGTEWMWNKEANGTQRPVKFWPVDKSRFLFDRRGNLALLTRETPVWGAYIKQMAETTNIGLGTERLLKSLPIGKFTYHVYEQDWGSWDQPTLEGYLYYGRGEDVNLYETVTRDFAVWLQEMLWLEQYGRPPRHMYVPPADWNTWASQIANDLLTKQIVAIPSRPNPTGPGRMFDVVQPEVPKIGFDAFGQARQRNTASIEKILLMNAGVMSDNDSGGGYSKHVSEVENGPTVMAKRDARRICDTITHQLIPIIVKFGPPELANCPESDLPILRLKSHKQDEPAEVIELFMKASQIAPVSLAEFYERSGLRKPTVPDDVIYTGQMMDELQGLLAQGAGQIPSNTEGPKVGSNGNTQVLGGNGDHRPAATAGLQTLRQPLGHNPRISEEREERE